MKSLIAALFFVSAFMLSPPARAITSEIEPNDDVGQTVISGESIYGNLSTERDIDRYAIEVAGAGWLTVTLSAEGINLITSPAYVYSGYDVANNLLARQSCKATTCADLTVALQAQPKYVVEIRSSSSFSAPDGFYTLR